MALLLEVLSIIPMVLPLSSFWMTLFLFFCQMHQGFEFTIGYVFKWASVINNSEYSIYIGFTEKLMLLRSAFFSLSFFSYEKKIKNHLIRIMAIIKDFVE